jgi:uncharacterized UBP type Zn finger protein
MHRPCSHLELAASRPTGVEPSGPGCEECLLTRGTWVHLRLCLDCGHVGCCDNSPGRHATKHYHRTRHAVIRSFEPGEEWGYCYPDDQVIESLPRFRSEVVSRHIDPPRS